MSKIIDLKPFPNNISTIIEYQPFDTNQKIELPTKTIIRIYGLAGAGKGTAAKLICQKLNIANLETSYILRSATWIYRNLALEYSEVNTDFVFEQLQVQFFDHKLHFFWQNEPLTDIQLRSNLVQENIAWYSGQPYFRNKYYEFIKKIFVEYIDAPFVLDGRGITTPYLNFAIENGFKVIPLFFWIDDATNYSRYRTAYLTRSGLETLSDAAEQALHLEFQKNILDRNQKDYQNCIDLSIGTLTPDTGIIDTSGLTPEKVLEVAMRRIVEVVGGLE